MQAAVDKLVVHSSVKRAPRGVTLPFTTYEAEYGKTNGTVIGPDRSYYTFAAESSGRQAVRLNQTGDFIEFRTAEASNFLDLRYIIPDSADGNGLEATLSLYVNGVDRGNLELSSRHSWVYGKYPWSNSPSDGDAHRFYDEIRRFIGEIPAGATIRLQKDEDDKAAFYVVDLVELEQAPDAFPKPEDYVSVTKYGAVADDGKDDSDAFREAIAAAQKGAFELWIPAGTFDLNQGPLDVKEVTVRGAGMWHTTLKGAGFMGIGNRIGVYDLAIDVNVTARRDELREAAFDGTFGTGSTFQQVWVEHAKAGIWSVRSDEGVVTDGLYVGGLRIRDTYADGINFSTGTKNSMVEQTHIRNSGDDSIAVWSAVPDRVSDEEPAPTATPCVTIRYSFLGWPTTSPCSEARTTKSKITY
ncbi:glycosyl hydrolase family 28-related protein [Cohnella kolymensis]|uniref:glycosyl hydrolase family 28-related protein n=1 Tax=Cohnella kolymensis TaxID=1590652 RepID=UPI0006982DD1|nr:glycosyl hydrolase family 28-related protein [Cohnella kolymensis]